MNRNSPLPVAVIAPLPKSHAERIRELSPAIELLDGLQPEALGRARVAYTNRALDPAEWPRLEWVQTNSVAVNHLAGTPLAKSGLPLANVKGAYAPAVAECAIGMMLSLTRRLTVCHDLQAKREWPRDMEVVRGLNCLGKTLALVGYGSSARHIARIAHAMGMKILASKRNPEERRAPGTFAPQGTGDPDGVLPEAWYGPQELARMLPRADVVMVTLPFTPSTIGLMGAKELESIAPGAYLINVGRGGVIDDNALLDCLSAGRITAAALDVFATEPLPADSPFWRIENVMVCPHVASFTREQDPMASEVLIENLRRYLEDRPLLNLVDWKLGY